MGFIQHTKTSYSLVNDIKTILSQSLFKHIRFCKLQIFLLSKNAKKVSAMFELGRFPLLIRKILRGTLFYIRINNLVSNSYLTAAIQSHENSNSLHVQLIRKIIEWYNIDIYPYSDMKKVNELWFNLNYIFVIIALILP